MARLQLTRTPRGTPVQTGNMADVQSAVQDILNRGDALAGEPILLVLHKHRSVVCDL